MLLEDGISIGGKALREIFEAVNHRKAFRYVKECIGQVKDFYADLSWKGKELNQIELAAWTHAEFVKIHLFTDGNGRTTRLIMNYQLMAEGFPAISIAKEDRLEYFKALQ